MKEIFVFGANLRGIHGAGAAKFAREHYGARLGEYRRTGDAYGIPTKDAKLKSLPLSVIHMFVKEFIDYATKHPELKFMLTRIGCGLAGYSDEDIAPMFRDAPLNVNIPVGFERVLMKRGH